MLALSACAFCAIAAVLHLASIAAVVRRMRRFESDETEEETLEGISIVRPVCGLENFTEETLLSGFRLEYPDYEILFCVAQPSDPVIPLVRRLIELHPHVPARLLIGNECVSANPKLNNFVKGWIAASHPWIVMADSNVMMPRDYIQRLFAAWRGDTGLVCSPQSGCIGVAAEADDGHIDVRVRDLLGIDTRDVGNDEIGPIDAVARHEVVRREERLQLGAEKSVDPTQQYRRHGENVPPVTACLQGSVSRW